MMQSKPYRARLWLLAFAASSLLVWTPQDAACLSKSHQRIPKRIQRIPKRIQLYYVVFNMETYVPITPQSIRREEPIVISDPVVIARIWNLLKADSGSGQFDSDGTRLLIESSDGERVMVDSGGGLKWGSRQYSLRPRAYLDLYLYLASHLPRAHPDHIGSAERK